MQFTLIPTPAFPPPPPQPIQQKKLGFWILETRLRSQTWCLLGVLLVTSLSKPQFICKLGTIALPLRIVMRITRGVVWKRAQLCAWYITVRSENINPSFFPFPISFKLLISMSSQTSALQSHFDFLFLPWPLQLTALIFQEAWPGQPNLFSSRTALCSLPLLLRCMLLFFKSKRAYDS